MASYNDFITFSNTHKMTGGGIYVIQPRAQKIMPIKIGYSKNLQRRMKDYKRDWPTGFDILGLARLSIRDKGMDNAKLAENFILDTIGDKVEYRNEWIDGQYRNQIMNSWIKAHNKYATRTALGTKIFTADDILNPTKEERTGIRLEPERRLTKKTIQEIVPVVGMRQFKRLKRLEDDPVTPITLRRSPRLN